MDEINREHLTKGSTWRRAIYMVLFAVIYRITEFVLFAVVVIQFLFKLLTGRANEQLRTAGQNLGAYIREMVLFLTFATEDMPYPFGPWPSAGAVVAKPSGTGRRRPKGPPASQTSNA